MSGSCLIDFREQIAPQNITCRGGNGLNITYSVSDLPLAKRARPHDVSRTRYILLLNYHSNLGITHPLGRRILSMSIPACVDSWSC